MKKTSAIIIIVFAFLFLFLPKVFANESYIIDKYDVLIEVRLDNSLKIMETIDVDFIEPKHGIIRNIPYRNKIIRLDESFHYNNIFISDIKVNEKNKVSSKQGNIVIKIGDENKKNIGQKQYIINYIYHLGKDQMKDYDELYYNIIGHAWDTSINNVTFKIIMPSEFDSQKVGFSSGTLGSVDNENIDYTIEEKTIIGKLTKPLNSSEGLTIRLELPEGYFSDAKIKLDFLMILAIILPILFVGYSARKWYIYGKDNKPIETVEFYPPGGLNSLDLAFMYKGKAAMKDTVSLLIYLANKGFLTVAEKKSKTIFKKDDFIITKVKDYDGDDINEKIFMKGLFQKKNKEKNSVSSKDLENNFYLTINAIMANTNTKTNRLKIYEKKSLDLKKNVFLMIFITLILMFLKPILEYKSMYFYLAYFNNEYYLLALIIGLIAIIAMLIFLKIMPKRNKYGNEILGKILGFKNFLETAEKSKLETLVKENPTYFYNILPYTYVLGVSDKWIKNFEKISINPPSWYESSTTFDIILFNSFLNSTYASAVNAMTSLPTNTTSGGGFSGGGSGGGGGSSW